MKKLTKLTAEQVALMAVVRDEWIGHGLSCEPADRATAEAGVDAAYAAANLASPTVKIWVASPLGGALADALVCALLLKNANVWANVAANVGANVRDNVWANVAANVGANVWDNVWANVWDNVGANVWDNVGANVWDNVWANVRDNVGADVRANVGANVRADVWDNVWANVRDNVRDNVWANVWANVRANVAANVWDNVAAWREAAIWGQHDAGWLAFVDYFRRVGLDDAVTAPAVGLMTVARSAGWWWARRGVVVLTDRPEICRTEPWVARNGQRLHCPDGPAIRYRDGWGVHAWHGTRVPADLIEGGWSLERILSEPNAEIRRCAIEHMGWDVFVSAAGLKPVDECDDPGNPGNRLALFDLPDKLNPYPERVRLLTCVNATPERDGTIRRFGLTVPADVDDALTAAAWTFGCTAKQYAALVRAT